MRKVYKHGLKFSLKLAENIDEALYRVFVLKKASMVIIDGGVGEGKTTLAEILALYITDKFNVLYKAEKDPPVIYEREKQLCLGGVDFMKKMSKFAEVKPVLLYDESGDFSKRTALTWFNHNLNRIFDTYRAVKVVVILILPSFLVLDNPIFFNKIPRLLIHLSKRSLSQGCFNCFSLWRMFYIKHKAKKLVVPDQAYNSVDPNFRGNFLDHDPEEAEALERYSLAGKSRIHKEIYARQSGLVTARDISRELGLTYAYARQIINKFKVEPQTVINRVKYYDRSVLERLRNR